MVYRSTNFVVNNKPTGITYRQLFGYIAMIAGGNARIDTTGRLRIISYDWETFNAISNIVNGGIFRPWDNPKNVDGGSFNPWNLGDVVDGGLFSEDLKYHILANWSNLKVDTDDVVITGVKCTYTVE